MTTFFLNYIWIFIKCRFRIGYPKQNAWNFTFKGLFKCASCGSSLVGEDKYRQRKYGKPKYHVYYHCTRQIDYDCPEDYTSEEGLAKALFRFINFMYIAYPHDLVLTDKIQEGIEEFKKMREALFLQQDINPNSKVWDIRDYARYVLTNKNMEEKRELFNLFKSPLFIKNSTITSLGAH